MNAPWFRTTDLSRWGAANSGGNLSGIQFDENTWFLYQAIIALQALPSAAAGIAFFSISGNQLTVTMTDHTTRGPYTIPISAFNFRGAWQPATTYFINDVVTANGACYIITWNHTSAATFNAGANDGLGHNYYGLMLASPGNSLPTGGAVGQMVTKTTTADFAVAWGWPLPTGGSIGQTLIKNSNTNQDASWKTSPWVSRPPVSPSASAGQILATVDGSDTNTEWVNQVSLIGLVSAPPASPLGLAGQFLQTVDGTRANTRWRSVILAPPASPIGIAGQILATVDGSSTSTEWVDIAATIDTIQFVIDGGGVPITTGMKGYLDIPYGCTITRATLLADQVGSIVINVWKCAYSAFDAGVTHPVAADKITSSTPPTISAGVSTQNATLSGWTTTVTAGDILAFNVDSVSSIQRITIALDTTR